MNVLPPELDRLHSVEIAQISRDIVRILRFGLVLDQGPQPLINAILIHIPPRVNVRQQ
jgi:hypothetical protein